MKLYKFVLLSVFVTSGCETMPDKPPQPIGYSKPINSLQTAEMLTHEAGYIMVGPKRNDKQVKEKLLYGGLRPESERRQFKRDPDRDDYAELPNTKLIHRTVLVPVPFGSAQFVPTYKQRIDIIQLAAVADRVEVRGRTDGVGDRQADEHTARLRAESGKRYLIDLGVPNNIISINYQSGGDYVSDNHREGGRRQNRRVELEFFIDDFTNDRNSKTPGTNTGLSPNQLISFESELGMNRHD